MHAMLAPVVKTLRNTNGRATWHDLHRLLESAAETTFDLGLERERRILDSTMYRGQRLLDGGGDPKHVLYIFTEKLPNARGVPKEVLSRDKAALKAVAKASGSYKIATGGSSG
ncbi:unnamed protein product, partial [Laminaria digitata]